MLQVRPQEVRVVPAPEPPARRARARPGRAQERRGEVGSTAARARGVLTRASGRRSLSRSTTTPVLLRPRRLYTHRSVIPWFIRGYGLPTFALDACRLAIYFMEDLARQEEAEKVLLGMGDFSFSFAQPCDNNGIMM